MAKALNRCRLCGSTARMAETTVAASGKTYYAVVCENTRCRLSEQPRNVRLAYGEPEWAAEAWNGGAR